MSSQSPSPVRRLRLQMLVTALAALALIATTAVAVARSFTVGVATTRLSGPSGHRRERIAVNGGGVAVYELIPETTKHPLCVRSSGCFGIWPPVTVRRGARLSRAAGIRAHLGTFRRDGFTQVTLGGHPLYTFAPDGGRRGVATGDGIHSFGGTWHVLRERSRHR